MAKVILVGGGGHCKSVIDVALSSNIDIFGILDPYLPPKSEILNIPVLGEDRIIEKYSDKYSFLITIGSIKNVTIRREIYSKIEACNGILAKILSSNASISKFSEIGDGTVIMHNSVVNSDVKIGANCIINTSTIIEHEVQVADFTHISTGAILNGNCTIGENVFVGSNSVIKQNIKICSDVIIGAQSFVNKDILVPGVYVGAPAKRINYEK